MNKKKQKAPAQSPMTPEQEAKSKASYKKTRRQVWIAAAVLILILLGVSFRNIVINYYYTFVLRSESISVAMENIDALAYTTGEKNELHDLQAQWDSYTASRLRDTVTAEAFDGAVLNGYYYDNGSDVTVLALHRYDGSGQDDFLYAPYFEDCNLLLPDARNHGNSGGDASTFGALERHDLNTWLQWIETNLGKQTVIIYGEDLGASTALLASETGLLTDNVAFIVAESPYTSLADLADYTLAKWYKIPKILTSFIGRYANSRGEFNYAEADPLSGAASGSCPVLFLMGENNEYIPAQETQALYDAWGGEKELCSYPSRNGLIYAENTEAIQSVLDAWMDAYVN